MPTTSSPSKTAKFSAKARRKTSSVAIWSVPYSAWNAKFQKIRCSELLIAYHSAEAAASFRNFGKQSSVPKMKELEMFQVAVQDGASGFMTVQESLDSRSPELFDEIRHSTDAPNKAVASSIFMRRFG